MTPSRARAAARRRHRRWGCSDRPNNWPRAASCCSTSMSRTTIGPLVTTPTGVRESRHASRLPRVSAVASLDRLIRVGGGAERHLLVRPGGPGQLPPQHLHEVRLHEDHRGEVVALAEFELMLVAAGETVVAAVRAAAVGVEGPPERHALDAVQCRPAADLLVGGVVGPLHRIGQRADAACLHQRGNVAGGRTRVAQVEERRRRPWPWPSHYFAFCSPQSSGDSAGADLRLAGSGAFQRGPASRQ